MSSRFSRILLALVVFLSSEVWALGLGDITMNSGLNEPLNARIELLSATPEELDALAIGLASADTFSRYGIDRPYYLQDMQFDVVRSGRTDGNYVQVTSLSPMAEPFLTFLVEAQWSRGRLLREYTVFLDPPTFTPQSRDTAPAVQAPTRTAPADSAPIQRPAPAPQPRTSPAPAPQPTQRPEPVVDDRPYSAGPGTDYVVARGDTLWGLAARVRPDSRLTMNQTMLAIFEANPQAFSGNINLLRAGSTVRIPSADEIFRIDRADALAEAQRQNTEWQGGEAVAVAETSTSPSLTLVPPDEEVVETSDTFVPEPEPEPEPVVEEPADESLSDELSPREQEILDRIAELESADVPAQQSLIEIRDNELAQLRDELSRIREGADGPFVDDFDSVEDTVADSSADDTVQGADAADAETTPAPENVIRTPTRSEPSLMDRVIEFATSIYGIITIAVILVVIALIWFVRRGGNEDDIENWQPVDRDEMIADDLTSTETMAAPEMEESIVVVEQERSSDPLDDTMEAAPTMEFDSEPTGEFETSAPPLTESFGSAGSSTDETGKFGSLEETFSSETGINLDQSDPIAEADFHMAYGLYDQAADLITGALSSEPERADLLTKLCEIYFVWGNRDAFIDAAGRLKASVGEGDSADWDKIVIMGQQIAADDALFAGASAAGATRAVDMTLGDGGDASGALDMDFGAEGEESNDVFDIGADDGSAQDDGDESVDFMLESTGETEPAVDLSADTETVEAGTDFDMTGEMPSETDVTDFPPSDDDTLDAAASDDTRSTPTIEEQFDVLSGTSELPSLDDTIGDAIESSGQSADETAEINLDELGLDVDGMADTELAALDDLDRTGRMESVDDTSISDEADEDLGAVTGRMETLDTDATGLQQALGGDDDTAVDDLDATGLNKAADDSLLEATGLTQVLGDDLAVDSPASKDDSADDEDATLLATTLGTEPLDDSIPDDAETLLASLDDDDGEDFDFAKTEALPKDAFGDPRTDDETGEMPAVASSDVELDLDDLTAALDTGDAGDTVEQPREDATVEYPRPSMDEDTSSITMSMSADEMSDDLSDARTMTEVGTKLDLARAYVDMGDPDGARSILEEVLDEGDQAQRQQAQQLLDSLPTT
jgi:pilus assembly protein FimV